VLPALPALQSSNPYARREQAPAAVRRRQILRDVPDQIREHEFVIEAVDDFLKKREIAENRRPLEQCRQSTRPAVRALFEVRERALDLRRVEPGSELCNLGRLRLIGQVYDTVERLADMRAEWHFDG